MAIDTGEPVAWVLSILGQWVLVHSFVYLSFDRPARTAPPPTNRFAVVRPLPRENPVTTAASSVCELVVTTW